MSSLYSKLSVLKDDENFFLNSRTNKTIKEIQKELNITIDEAMVLSIIMSYQIQDTYSTSFDSLKKDFKLQSDEYLKYLNIAYKLEKKGFIALAEERRRGRSSRISPEFNVDDMIFNKLILGYDYLDDVDFSDIYSVVKVIAELIYKKDDKKLTEFRLVSEANRVFDKLDIKEEFTKAILKYSIKEKLIITALQITLEKRLHDHILPSIDGIETLVIAAINPEDDQKIYYQVDELDVALKDRFLYYEMKLDVKSWLDWARENNIIDEITSFISEFPDRLFYFTQESTYPTPRSWAKLSELLLKAPKLKTNELKTIIFGKLGQTIGSQFYSYYKDFSNMITIKNIEEFILEQTSFSNQEISIKLKNSLLADKSKIWLSEMAQKLFKKYIGDKNNQKVLMTYLDSIDLEILASFFTNIKEQNENSLAKFILLENGREIINKIADKIEF
ncbi:hypothetical protein [Aliarcobacter butzleri]|uniref:hypothetical protein n=1 Tax=Aliarcobacter butzleri TaxID=28197 RepID=UPI002B24A2EC|nr:hypothetical protein [Aliarcobacter butzleri]